MKNILVSIILCCVYNCAFAQERDTLHAFFNADSTFVGYKDAQGKVVVPANLNASFGLPQKFSAIISVIEENKEGNYDYYFLTRTGKIIGIDSLYFFDNTPDCENEGFIRFQDRKADKVGLLNAKGEIQIPAQYSAMEKVKNGMIIVLSNAQRKLDGEHSFWVGGETSLIDTNNQVVIADFPYRTDLDFYNVRIDDPNEDENFWEHFKAVNGKTYSFINFEKEFKQHLKDQFELEVRDELLNQMCFDTVACWTDSKDLVHLDDLTFVEKYLDRIKPILTSVMDGSADYFISHSHLNPFIFEGPLFEKYYDNCGDSMEYKYPVMSLIVNHDKTGKLKQTHLDFLRTEDGYKLISVSLGI